MIDKKEIRKIIKWAKEHPEWVGDYDEDFAEPLLDAANDDKDGLFAFLEDMKLEDLDYISGIFDNIDERWPGRDTEKRLRTMANKLKDAGYDVYW